MTEERYLRKQIDASSRRVEALTNVGSGRFARPVVQHPDVDWGGVDFAQMEKIARAHAYVIDQLSAVSKDDLHGGGEPVPEQSIYQSDLLKILMGNN